MRLTLLLLLAASAGACHANRLPIVPAGADGRFELSVDPAPKIDGLAPRAATLLRADVNRLVDYLRTLPAVAQPPDHLCMRLSSHIGPGVREAGVVPVNVYASLPVSYRDGKCHLTTGSGVTFTINHEGWLFSSGGVSLGKRKYYVLPIRKVDERIVWMKNYDAVIVRAGRLPWRPAPRAAYLESKLEQANAALEAVAAADREFEARTAKEGKPPQPRPRLEREYARAREQLRKVQEEIARPTGATRICLGLDGEFDTSDRCPEDRVVVEPNPDYYDRTRPERIQLLRVHTPPEQGMDTTDRAAVRMAIWRAVDWAQLTGMVLE